MRNTYNTVSLGTPSPTNVISVPEGKHRFLCRWKTGETGKDAMVLAKSFEGALDSALNAIGKAVEFRDMEFYTVWQLPDTNAWPTGIPVYDRRMVDVVRNTRRPAARPATPPPAQPPREVRVTGASMEVTGVDENDEPIEEDGDTGEAEEAPEPELQRVAAPVTVPAPRDPADYQEDCSCNACRAVRNERARRNPPTKPDGKKKTAEEMVEDGDV